MIDTRCAAKADAGDQQSNTHTFFSTTLSDIRRRSLSAVIDEIAAREEIFQ
jgi:hypothetical protein